MKNNSKESNNFGPEILKRKMFLINIIIENMYIYNYNDVYISLRNSIIEEFNIFIFSPF